MKPRKQYPRISDQHLRLERELDDNAKRYLCVTPIPPPPRLPTFDERWHRQDSTQFAFGFVCGMLTLVAIRLAMGFL